jgi:penicillin G amidase
VKGNIGWYAAGKIPVRRTGTGETIYRGSTGEGDWTGFIPFEELPYLYNPPSGFIVTANQRIVGTDYKYQQMSRDAAPPWRARRIVELIEANPKITMNDVRDIQLDVFNIPLSRLAREIVGRGAASPETIAVLRGWDGRMAADSKGALLTNEIRTIVANRIAAENKPVPAYIVRERLLFRIIEENSARWLPAGFASYDALLRTADAEARENLAKRYGTDQEKWVWGSAFQARFSHPLAAAPLIGQQFAVPPVGLSGSGQTPNVGSAVSMRLIASPGNWDATRHVIPLGQSGDSLSPFWKDQFESWRTGSPQVFPFSKDAVARAAAQILVMTPR